MRFGRNIARTLLEYYRFTNVLMIPMLKEIRGRKERPKTHRSRSKRRIIRDISPRPRTTRKYAPISCTDLVIHYDSSTSNDGSPTRSGFGDRANKNIFLNVNQSENRSDQHSLIALKSSKKLDFINTNVKYLNAVKQISQIKSSVTVAKTLRNDITTVIVPPKPSLSIIDFNQLTRDNLEAAKRK